MIRSLGAAGPIFALLAFLLFAAGCATTRLTDVWQSSESVRRFSSLVVVGIDKSESSRRVFEDEMVELLEAAGVQAVPSFRFAAEAEDASFKELGPVLKRQGVDGILATRVLNVEKEQVVYESGYFPEPYYQFYYRYHRYGLSLAHRHSYVSTRTRIRMETNLYEARTQKLVWAAQSKSVEPGSAKRLVGDLGPLLIEQLRKADLLAFGEAADQDQL